MKSDMAKEEEAKSSASSAKNSTRSDDLKAGENEEFYETIEAPKYVDFTVPDHYRPDDRYWFCFRVGCDQKHEEEMDSEAIYKNFVLRVMAARSPNVRLHKALNRNRSGKKVKCPLSAPPKSSKSRLSQLAIISAIPEKMDDKKEKVKPVPKVCSTPKAKGKQVAAKYLSTPRNKKCTAKPNAFASVQNTKPPNVAVPKSRMVAKTLVFHSPKKAFSIKTSVELRTPLTKLCEKLKKLEITSERKTALGHSSKQSKKLRHHSQKSVSVPVHPSASRKVPNKDAKPLRFSKAKSKGKQTKQSSVKSVPSAGDAEAKSRDELSGGNNPIIPVKEVAACPILNGPSSDASKSESNSSSNSDQTNMAGNDVPTLQAAMEQDDDNPGKVQESVSQPNSNNVLPENGVLQGAGSESETTHDDDKENASAFDERRSFNCKNDHSGRKILGTHNSDGRKVTEGVDKNSKGQAASGASGVKLLKLKPTNPKPFKLRTDERGILREANLGRKNDAMALQKEAAVVSRFQSRDLRGQHVNTQKGIALQPTKQPVRMKTLTGTCEKLDQVAKKAKYSSGQLYVTPEATTPDNPPSAIVEASSGNSKSKDTMKKCREVSRIPATSSRSISHGRCVATIPKEPKFHGSHIPRRQEAVQGKSSG